MNETHPSLLSSLRSLPRPVWILFFGTFLNKFGAFVIPFLTLYMTGRGYKAGDAGLAIAAYGLGNLLAAILGGHLADHFGRRKTIAVSMFSGAAVMLLLSCARTLPEIIVLTGLAGLTGELYRPASSALLADLIPPDRRVTAYSAYRMAFNAGWAFGPATAGFLAGHSFFWLFVGDAMTSVLFGLVALIALPRGGITARKESGWAEAFQRIGRDRQLHQVLLSTIFVGVIFFQMASTFGLHVVHQGLSPKVYGFLLSLNGALVVCCELPLTTVTRRYPSRSVMSVGYVLCGLGFALNAFAHNVPALVACMVVFTLGEMISMPVSVAYVAELAPPQMRGRYMGMYTMVWAVGMMIGPNIGVRFFSTSPMLLWLTCGACGLIAAVLIRLPVKRAPVPQPVHCGASV